MDSRIMINLTLAFLFSTVFLTIFPSQTDAVNGVPVQQLIDIVCKHPTSGGYKSCLAILEHNPAISSATDTESLARIALQPVIAQSSSILAFLALTIKSQPGAAKPLGTCVTNFSNTKRQLVLDHEELKRRLASLDVHYAQDSVDACENVLANAKVSVPALGAMITKWRSLFIPAYAAVIVAEG